jgi:predicted alternative tryptophan synthase beta-subunit
MSKTQDNESTVSGHTAIVIAKYAAGESAAAGMGIRFHALLPRLSRDTELGRAAVRAYAQRAGITEQAFAARAGAVVTPRLVGESVLSLVSEPEHADTLRFQLTGEGLQPMDG